MTTPLNDDDREALTAYLDGELDEESTQVLEARLGREPSLRAELDVMKQTWGLLDFLPRPAPSADFTHRTIERLSTQVRSTQSAGWSRPGTWRRSLRWGGAVAASLLIGFAAGHLYRSRFETPLDPDETLLRNVRLLERLPAYDTVDDLGFLKALSAPDLFGEDDS